MYEIKQLENAGPYVDYDDPYYPVLEEAIRRAKNGVPVGEIGTRTHGIIVPLTDEVRNALERRPEGEALLWWTDGEREDGDDGINVLDAKTAKTLTEESAAAIVERVLAHYANAPEDDGHPAYALYARQHRG